MRPQPFLFAGLALLAAAEAHAQTSLYSPEMSRIRWALAAFVALLLFLSIRRGSPVRGSRGWFWHASADELGPELAKLRQRALNLLMPGAFLLFAAFIAGGYVVGDAVVEAFERDGHWLDHLEGPGVFLVAVLAALGLGLVIRGLGMAPKDEPGS